MSLSTDADVAAAEGDLAALRVHADRLADGFVKRRLARHLETVADEVAAARRALAPAGGDAPTSAAAAAARTEARRALAAAAGAGVPRSPAEATAVALHFALLAVAGDSLRAVGAGAAAAVPGFAPRASELPAANRLPADWRRDDGGRFQYRSTSGEALEDCCEVCDQECFGGTTATAAAADDETEQLSGREWARQWAGFTPAR